MSMTRRQLGSALLAGSASVVTSGCSGLFGQSGRLRYRLTILCLTPDGIMTASGVQETERFVPVGGLQPPYSGRWTTRGDALVLPVGDKRYFLPLPLCASMVDYAMRAGDVRPPSAKASGNNAENARAFARANGRAEIDGARFMAMPWASFRVLTFDDLHDFATLRQIDGERALGWSPQHIEVATTDEAITRQAIAELPWIPGLQRSAVRDQAADGRRLLDRLSDLSDAFGNL